MTISIELFGQLAPQLPRRMTFDFEARMKVRSVVMQLKLNAEEIGLMTINGVQSELDDLLEPGCRLCFFPYMSGG